MVFTEAKALGIPIISADFLTAKEFVSDGEDGIICPIDEMADKIYGFIKNKELQERIKSNLQKRGTGNADTLLRFEKLVNI
jgi:glycosyltransferase involved in cell wall biosynthesis